MRSNCQKLNREVIIKLRILKVEADLFKNYIIKAEVNTNVHTYYITESTYLKVMELYRLEDYVKCLEVLNKCMNT